MGKNRKKRNWRSGYTTYCYDCKGDKKTSEMAKCERQVCRSCHRAGAAKAKGERAKLYCEHRWTFIETVEDTKLYECRDCGRTVVVRAGQSKAQALVEQAVREL